MTSSKKLDSRQPHGLLMMSRQTLLPTGLRKKSRLDSEQSFNHQLRVSQNQLCSTIFFQNHSTQEPNGNNVFTPLEIKLSAVHAGLSLQLRLYQIESVLLQKEKKMSFSHLKILSHVTGGIEDAMEVFSHGPGPTYKRLVQPLMNACHMFQIKVQFHHAQVNAMMDQRLRDTNALMSSKLRV